MEADEHPVQQTENVPEKLDLGPEPEKPMSGFQVFLRKAVRWLLIALFLFVLGGLAAFLLFYQPRAQRLSQQLTRAEATLTTEREQVSALETEVARLSGLDTENKALATELATANRRLKLLRALSEVHAARVDLATEDIESARASLANTDRTLTELASLAGADYREQITAMQSRLQLALDEMERDAFAAQSDLGVLAAQLMQLDNQFLTSPD